MLDRDVLIRVAHKEMQEHSFETFVDDPPTVAQRGPNTSIPSRCRDADRLLCADLL
jgi:hypothetical protein